MCAVVGIAMRKQREKGSNDETFCDICEWVEVGSKFVLLAIRGRENMKV